MDAIYEKYALAGWLRVTKIVSISVAGNASGTGRLTSDGARAFAVVEIGEGHTGAYVFGVVSNVEQGIPVVATGVTGTGFFGASNALPTPFARELAEGEEWVFSITDTSAAPNVVVFVVHGYVEPVKAVR